MDTFSIIRNALAATENDPDKVGLAQDIIDAGRIIAAVQVVVDALTPPDGGRYIVGFKDIATAGTSLADQTHHGQQQAAARSRPDARREGRRHRDLRRSRDRAHLRDPAAQVPGRPGQGAQRAHRLPLGRQHRGRHHP